MDKQVIINALEKGLNAPIDSTKDWKFESLKIFREHTPIQTNGSILEIFKVDDGIFIYLGELDDLVAYCTDEILETLVKADVFVCPEIDGGLAMCIGS